MSVGDNTDMFGRLKNLLPVGWFGDNNPIRDALLWGYANALAWGYTLYLYAKDQTRIKSATDGWLDLIALDFFGNNLIRRANQGDDSYRSNILVNLFRERTTRHAMEKVLLDLTGRTPIIIEPARPADVGAYGAAVAVSQPGTTTMIDNGMIVYVPPNTPRYQAGQLLIEGANTNITPYGTSLKIGWARGTAAIWTDGQVFVDGNPTAVLAEGLAGTTIAGAGSALYRTLLPVTAGLPYTFSLFAKLKNPSATGIRLRVQSNPSGTNFQADTLLTKTDWARATATVTIPLGDTSVVLVAGTPAAGSPIDVYLGGAQLELGSSATSYIPTTSAAVTRAADTLLNNMSAGSAAMGGYGAAGAYGSLSLPYQAFITVFRPSGQGLPYIAGYGISTGGYSTPSRSDYAQYSDGGVTDADIYAAIAATKPEGIAVWARLSS